MKRQFHIFLVAAVMLLCTCFSASAQRVAVKTNALSWMLATPDIGVEVVTGEHTSVGVSAFGHYWGNKSSLAALQPEFRYWFNGRPLTREYIGASATGILYDNSLSDHRYNGYALSLGLTGGYVFSLGSRWSFELSGGMGVLLFRHEQTYKDDISQIAYLNHGYKLFPAKLNASFIYIIK